MTGTSVFRSETPQCEPVAAGPPEGGVRPDMDSGPRRHISRLTTLKTRRSCDSVQTGDMW